MQAGRLLSLQMLLQAHGRLSAQALADMLQVSVRTVHRDIDQLSSAGVPVYAERGRAGGFALLDGWKTSLTGLTPAESQAVLLCGLAGPAAELGMGDGVASARLKLLAALPAAASERAQLTSTRLHLDPMQWYTPQAATPHLLTVAQAVWQGCQLRLRYASWRQTALRTVGPLGLVLKAGVWYVVALSGNGRVGNYRVSNMLMAELIDEQTVRPNGFDLARYWAEATKRFERELYGGEAVVLATPKGLKRLAALSRAVAQAVQCAPASRRKDGRVRLRIPIETVAHATDQLLPLAPEVEVQESEALRASLISRVRGISHLYGLNTA